MKTFQQERISLVYRTHQIFTGIKNKDIVLLTGNPPGRTDTETFICVPIEDPDVDLIHAHEWQHIFFKTNLRARALFVEDYVTDLRRRLGDQVKLVPVTDFMHLVINALDDLRVCSLWELIYPGTAGRIQDRWRRLISASKRSRSDMVMYLMALGLGLRPERSDWQRYSPVLLDAVQKVLRRGFPACLVASRWIVETVLQDALAAAQGERGPVRPAELLPAAPRRAAGRMAHIASRRPLSPPGAQDRQAATLNRISEGATRGSPFCVDVHQPPTGTDPDRRGTRELVRAAMGVSTHGQVELLLRQSQVEIERALSELRSRPRQLSKDERLLQGLEGRVRLVDVIPKGVDELRLDAKDQLLVSRMRHTFERLLGRKRHINSEEGSTLDPQAYIDAMMGSNDFALFEDEAGSRGFSALILLDMSGSMAPKWATVARACKVLARAMRFPFSQIEVWGFSSTRANEALILRFQDPSRGYMGPGVADVWGLTPLHLALEVAVRRLRAAPGPVRHLFVLTDGNPTYINLKTGVMTDTATLLRDVLAQVSAARHARINVAGLLTGYAVTDQAANIMFGNRRFWSRVEEQEEDIFRALTALVEKAFIEYLRRR